MLADVLHVERVPVDAHFFDDLGADSMVMAQFCARVRKRADLPAVVDQGRLPAPHDQRPRGTPRLAAADHQRPSKGPSPQLLAEVIKVDSVPVDSHFFDDLGADSMVMAQFCARVRKRADLPAVSIKDVYQHPTIAGPGGGVRTSRSGSRGVRHPGVDSVGPARTEAPVQASTIEYFLCGALQFLLFLGYTYLAGIVFERTYEWIAGGWRSA